MPKYLMDEYPIMVYPSLAKAVGLNESIALQKLHGWLAFYEEQPERHTDHFQNGRYWVYGTPEYWSEQIPFLSAVTIRRALKNLRDMGIVVTDVLNEKRYDRTLWYSIDYEAYEQMIEAKRAEWRAAQQVDEDTDEDPSDQVDQMACSKRSDGCDQNEQVDPINMSTPIPICSSTSSTTSSTTDGANAPTTPDPSSESGSSKPEPDPENTTAFSSPLDQMLRTILCAEAAADGRRGPTKFETLTQKRAWRDAAETIIATAGEDELHKAINWALERGRKSRARVIATLSTWAANLQDPQSHLKYQGNGNGNGKLGSVLTHEQWQAIRDGLPDDVEAEPLTAEDLAKLPPAFQL